MIYGRAGIAATSIAPQLLSRQCKHRPAPLTIGPPAGYTPLFADPLASRSTNHVGPPGGLTSFAGYLCGSASPSRISLSASALPSPATRTFTARAALRAG